MSVFYKKSFWLKNGKTLGKSFICMIFLGKSKTKLLRDFEKSDILLVSSGIQKDTLTKPDLLIIGIRTHRNRLFVNINKNFANNYTNTKRTNSIQKANTTE